MKYALVENGVVINIVLWDGSEQWSPGDGVNSIAIDENFVDIGWIYENGEFFSDPETGGVE